VKDQLGDRIKSKFEDVFRFSIPQRTYGIVRVDGKAFHTFTRGLERPYCRELSDAMDTAAMALAKEMMGCKLAYGQSDEYSFLFTDLAKDADGEWKEDTEMWFNGNIQKISSISSSIFTAYFNQRWREVVGSAQKGRLGPPVVVPAMFDARVFVIPSRADVEKYFIWRQNDATRNSLSMLARHHFSAKELHGKGSSDMHEMLHGKSVNWNNQPIPFKRGRVIRRMPNSRTVSFVHKKTKETINKDVQEMAWMVDEKIPAFNRDKSYLEGLIP
jgi:tRNA(His) guanylyltransferase